MIFSRSKFEVKGGCIVPIYLYSLYQTLWYFGYEMGQRRYQNKNGSLTSAGKKRYKYTSMSTNRYARKVAKNKEKAAEHRRYAEDYNPKNYIGKSKYTDRQKARDQKNMNKELAIARKYEEKAQKMENRAKRSQEFDDNYMNERIKRTNAKGFATAALVGFGVYDAYIRQRDAGIEKGKAMVSTFLGGQLAAAKVRSDYINQDVKKNRNDS